MAHEHVRIKARYVTWPTAILFLIIMAGGLAVIARMALGLGVTTNLSDTWPWGLWKGFNVLVLIALGAGGFTSAALIYIFGGDRYHGFARSIALWGLLCYSFAGGSLAVDIAIPWRIVYPIVLWPKHSILFEVAWCVMLYITVLALEVAPTVFERFSWLGWLETMWKYLVTPYAVVALSFFTFIMTHSLGWAATSLVFFTILSLLFRKIRNKPSTPILLIMFGVILSTLHQSSLGSLFLLMPDKLSHYWWSPRIPINFLLSAIMSGFAMLIIERTISTRVWKRAIPEDLLTNMSKALLTALGIYTTFRLTDVLVQFTTVSDFGGIAAAFGGASKGALFVTEIFGGLFLPAAILIWPRGRENPRLRMTAAVLVALGVVFNRLNVTFIGMMLPGVYIPSFVEILVSAATVAAILFLFIVGVKLMPIYMEKDQEDEPEMVDSAVPATT